MTGALHAPFPLALLANPDVPPSRGLTAAAERLGLALLVWAGRRRWTPPRTVDLRRVRRADPPLHPFC